MNEKMTAEEMFLKLGFRKLKTHSMFIAYCKFGTVVHFNLYLDNYIVYENHNEAVFVNTDLHEAITQQLKELPESAKE